jgi:hypothetical protein
MKTLILLQANEERSLASQNLSLSIQFPICQRNDISNWNDSSIYGMWMHTKDGIISTCEIVLVTKKKKSEGDQQLFRYC